MWKLVIFTISFLVISHSAYAIDRYVCQVETKQVCKKTGCVDLKLENDDYRIIDTRSQTYTIGKKTFPLAGEENSGAFKIFKVGESDFLKLLTIDAPITQKKRGEFIEVKDMFLKSFISHGTCKF